MTHIIAACAFVLLAVHQASAGERFVAWTFLASAIALVATWAIERHLAAR